MREYIESFLVTHDSVQYTVAHNHRTDEVLIVWNTTVARGKWSRGDGVGGLFIPAGHIPPRDAYNEINSELADHLGYGQ